MSFKLSFSYEMFACATLSLHIHTQSKFHTSKSVCPYIVKSNRHLHVATLVLRRLERGATQNLGSHTWWKPEQT